MKRKKKLRRRVRSESIF